MLSRDTDDTLKKKQNTTQVKLLKIRNIVSEMKNTLGLGSNETLKKKRSANLETLQ